jgi:enoyl-CoA hydratase/3-hydroxyacyl-CoA dehydrogenase
MIVGVIGSGAIGPDLAYGFLSALARDPSSKVYLVDISQEALDAGSRRIAGYLQKGVARGKIAASAAKAISDMLVTTSSLADLAGATTCSRRRARISRSSGRSSPGSRLWSAATA